MLIKLSQHRSAEGSWRRRGCRRRGVVWGEDIGGLCPSSTPRCAISQRLHSPALPSQYRRGAPGLLPTLAPRGPWFTHHCPLGLSPGVLLTVRPSGQRPSCACPGLLPARAPHAHCTPAAAPSGLPAPPEPWSSAQRLQTS